MMKTFLISLENQPRRRKILIEDLERLQLKYEIFNAVNGYGLAQQDIEQLCDLTTIEQNQSWFTKGMIGCVLSHYYLYQQILKEGLPYAFIIEDDTKLPDNIHEIINAIEHNIQKKEVILLYYQSMNTVCKISTINAIKITGKHILAYPLEARSLGTTGAYIITREACEIMSKLILPIRKGPDDWGYFSKAGGINIRVFYPRVIKNYDFRSTISSISNFDKKTILSKSIDWIDENRIFPFFQLLAWRRNHNKSQKRSQFELIEQRSAMDKI